MSNRSLLILSVVPLLFSQEPVHLSLLALAAESAAKISLPAWFYPDWLYALARWLCVALLAALPFLCARFVTERPRLSALLLLTSGIALSCCVVTEILRYLGPANPWGRFILPFLPLAALPVLAQMEAPGRQRPWRIAIAAGVGLQVWTAFVVIGGRYLFKS